MVMRTPGRRYLEVHWHTRLAILFSFLLLMASLATLYIQVYKIKGPHNPHFESAHCFDCHDARGSKMTAVQCFDCHDHLSRELLPGAFEKRLAMSEVACSHPLKKLTPTKLCLSCHDTVSGVVVMTNISDGEYIEIDMSITHPIGLMPSEVAYPKTLHLSDVGSIDCVTCHDPHGLDPRMKLLRYYHPGNGHPPDFRSLCNDCHSEGWLPLRLKRTDIVIKKGR
jgi:hypothetical protein